MHIVVENALISKWPVRPRQSWLIRYFELYYVAMAFGKSTAFQTNPFTDRELKLVDIPPAPETHEPLRPLRSYLVTNNMANQITTALSPLIPGAPQPSRKVEVERIRQVETLSQEPEPEQSQPEPPPPPKWNRG